MLRADWPRLLLACVWFVVPVARADEPSAVPSIGLPELLRRAQSDPPRVRAAHAAYLRAQAEHGAASAAWFPSLTAQGSLGYGYNNQLVLPGLPRIDSLSLDGRANAGLDWAALDLTRGASIDAREAAEQSSAASAQAAQRTAAAQAAELYVLSGAATELIGDAQLTLERRTQMLTGISELVRAGKRSPVEVERARVEMVSARYALAMRQSDERASQAALAAALGRPATEAVRPATPSAEFPAAAAAVTAQRAAQLALERRPELRAASWAVAALRQDYQAALLARLPTLGVTASALYLHSQVVKGDGIDGNQYGASAGLYIRWRGLDPAVVTRANVAEAAAVAAERERQASEHAIRAEAVAAFHALERAKLERERALEVLRVSGVTREAQGDRYRAGVASLLELLDAEALEQTARQRRIEAERDEAVASVRLLASCGLLSP